MEGFLCVRGRLSSGLLESGEESAVTAPNFSSSFDYLKSQI